MIIKEKVVINPNINIPFKSEQTGLLRFEVLWSYYLPPEGLDPVGFDLITPDFRTVGYDPITKTKTGNYTMTNDYTMKECSDGSLGIYSQWGRACYDTLVSCPGYYQLTVYVDNRADFFASYYILNIYYKNELVYTLYVYRDNVDDYFTGYYTVGENKICQTFEHDYWLDIPRCIGTEKKLVFTPSTFGVQYGGAVYAEIDLIDEYGNATDPPEPYCKMELVDNSAQWGLLEDYYTGKRGTVLDSVSFNSMMAVYCYGWGKEPDVAKLCTLRVSTYNGTIAPADLIFYVVPPQIHATPGRSEISYGDTTALSIKVRQSSDGEWMDKPSDWRVDYQIVQADTFGIIYNADSSQTGSYLYDYSSQIHYASNYETKPDSTEVLIQMHINEPGSGGLPCSIGVIDSLKINLSNYNQFNQALAKKLKQKNIKQQINKRALNRFNMEKSQQYNNLKGTKRNISKSTATSSIADYVETEHYGLARIVLKKESSEILLGETRYYQAWLDPSNGNKLSIKELKETSEWTSPPLPVQFNVDQVSGGKLGVYYESKDEQGSDIEPNLIRLVGRYWEQGNTYKVKVTASYNGLTASKIIEVKKPARLLKPGQSPTFTLTRDVFKIERNIDSVCIYYSGKYGVPPQFIKGQMMQEAAQADFGYTGFAPTYCYEPYGETGVYDRMIRRHKYFIDKDRNPKEIRMGTGLPVPDHDNVKKYDYFYQPVTVWNFIEQYSQLEDVSRSSRYGIRRVDGFMDYSAYPKLQYYYWNEIVTVLINKELRGNELANESRKVMSDYLRYKWASTDLNNVSAQTRIYSSYGLLQMMYNTARNKAGYPYNQYDLNAEDNPERLNVTDIGMYYSMIHMTILLQKGFSATNVSNIECNWPEGIEKFFKKYVYHPWNPYKESYPDEVMAKVAKFKPSDK